jgi:chromosome transmission fidelity protein 8
MIIEIACPDGVSTPEWMILELQGKLVPAACLAGASVDGRLMGRLDPSPGGDANKFLLQVGTYRVSGSLVVLKKPLLLIHRSRHAPAEETSGDAEGAAEGVDPEAVEPDDYAIRAVIRKKFVFAERPQPIVGSAAEAPR